MLLANLFFTICIEGLPVEAAPGLKEEEKFFLNFTTLLGK